MVASKTCTRCRQDLPASEYYAFRRNRDGLASYCKECMKAVARKWHHDNLERIRARRAAKRKGQDGSTAAAV